MTERGIAQNEEKKSYSSILGIGIGLLVAFSLWAFWDDNITRRPWKAFQSRFYRLDYTKAQTAYDEENKKLQADANYQELTKKLAAAQASVKSGELSQKLAPSKSKTFRRQFALRSWTRRSSLSRASWKKRGTNTIMRSSKSGIQNPTKTRSSSWKR